MQRHAEAIDALTAESTQSAGCCAPVQVAGNELTIYYESGPLIEAMLADIRAANKRVWMETYILANDDAGRQIVAALTERARAGVEVRLMVDAWGSWSLPSTFFRALTAAGGQVHYYHAFREALRGFTSFLHVLNQRNHRKLLVIDKAVAYFGGMNVVDQSGIRSPADARARKLPASAGWRDVHVRLAGPQQSEIAKAMQRTWRDAHGEKLRPTRWPIEGLTPETRDSIHFFGSRPTFKNYRPQRIIVPLLSQASREITMAVAYFAPPRRVLRALFRARKRGVRIRLILPGYSDVRVLQWAARHFYKFLLKRRIAIYERDDRMLHSKVMVIDHEVSLVGSCNLDHRSLLMNLEFLAVIRSQAFSQSLLSVCHEEMQASTRINQEYIRQHGFFQRLLHWLAWRYRRWL